MTAAVGYGLIAVVVFVALSLAHAHVILKQAPPVPHLLGMWLGLAIVMSIAVRAVTASDRLALVLTNLAVYLAFGEVYLFVYAVAVGSLSVRILVRTLALETPAPEFERTFARQSPEGFFEIRLKSLLAQGLLAQRDGRYRPTEKGRRWALAGRWLKRLLAVGTGG